MKSRPLNKALRFSELLNMFLCFGSAYGCAAVNFMYCDSALMDVSKQHVGQNSAEKVTTTLSLTPFVLVKPGHINKS